MATYCDFGIFLNHALHDQPVIGLRQDSIQRKLLAEDKFTFKKACVIARAIELAERNTCELKAVESREVRAVSDRHESVRRKADQLPSSGHKKSCYRCGGQRKAVVC